MKKYNVTGMSCAACSARVERAVAAVEGVSSCSVNLLTNSMLVEGNVSDDKIIAAVVAAGYGASVAATASYKDNGSDIPGDKEAPNLLRRLLLSVGFLLALMYISMGHVMWGFPLPALVDGNPVAVALAELILSAAVMIINHQFFVRGFKGVLRGVANMDTLVALGSGASFVYSVCVLFVMTEAQIKGDIPAATHHLHELYFESAAMILALITVGKMLEAVSKGRTTKSLRSLMDLSPKTATLISGDEEKVVSIDDVCVDDIFAVRPGESIPVDGIIVHGGTSVDESALTGESVPADKSIGDRVSAGTINRSGFIRCKATEVGENTTLSQIIKIVSDATASKAPIAKAADRISAIFVPTVMVIAIVTAIVWLLVNNDIGFALARAVSVLVISCPCALGLATPVAIMVGSGVGARKGILYKNARALEVAGRADTVVLDKTGTVTKGEMSVTDIIASEGFDERQLLSIAYSVEKGSEHPLGAAVVQKGEELGAEDLEIEAFEAISGKGVQGFWQGKLICGGNLAFVEQNCNLSNRYKQIAYALAEGGKTPMFFSCDGVFAGIIAVADEIKQDSAYAISELKSMGLRVIMLTGDNARTARAIGRAAGVDEIISDVMPNGKANKISELQAQGRVIMVGDGINDAPALATADTGIAIGAGTDVAIEAADVVLMNDRLSSLPSAIKLSRATLRNIHQNLFWAFCYNVIGIPLAAGVWISVFGWELDPMFSAAAMSLSSFCVVMNALRLNLVNIDKPAKARKARKTKKTADADNGDKNMKKTLKIEGMMCTHCSGRVKKALESLDAVVCAEVSHEKGTAIVTLTGTVSDELLKATVEEQGYSVPGIE